MGEKVINVDFVKRKRVVKGETSGYPTTVELRGAIGSERSELTERTAIITARLELARARGDELETQDLGLSLRQHIEAFTPGLTEKEVDEINKRASQVLSELMGIGG